MPCIIIAVNNLCRVSMYFLVHKQHILCISTITLPTLVTHC